MRPDRLCLCRVAFYRRSGFCRSWHPISLRFILKHQSLRNRTTHTSRQLTTINYFPLHTLQSILTYRSNDTVPVCLYTERHSAHILWHAKGVVIPQASFVRMTRQSACRMSSNFHAVSDAVLESGKTSVFRKVFLGF